MDMPEPSSDGISPGSIALLVGTSTVAIAGLVGGIVLSTKANDRQARADELEGQLPRDESVCNSPDLKPVCSDYADAQKDAITDRRWATAGFVTFGVASAATIGYALWLGLSDSSPPPVQASVSIGGRSASIGVRGAF
jgi:hypothetical protein